MSGGYIGMITWEDCDFCENYSEENGCEIMMYRDPSVEIELASEEIVCLDFEAKNE